MKYLAVVITVLAMSTFVMAQESGEGSGSGNTPVEIEKVILQEAQKNLTASLDCTQKSREAYQGIINKVTSGEMTTEEYQENEVTLYDEWRKKANQFQQDSEFYLNMKKLVENIEKKKEEQKEEKISTPKRSYKGKTQGRSGSGGSRSTNR